MTTKTTQYAQLEHRELKLNNCNFRRIRLAQLKLEGLKSHDCDTRGTKRTIKLKLFRFSVFGR